MHVMGRVCCFYREKDWDVDLNLPVASPSMGDCDDPAINTLLSVLSSMLTESSSV